MPEICEFKGITVSMYYRDTGGHNLPHVHVSYSGKDAVIGLSGKLLAGKLPPAQLKLLRAWLVLRQDELLKEWEKAVRDIKPEKIAP